MHPVVCAHRQIRVHACMTLGPDAGERKTLRSASGFSWPWPHRMAKREASGLTGFWLSGPLDMCPPAGPNMSR